MKIRKFGATLLALALVTGGSLVLAAPASADSEGTMPSGCSISPSVPSTIDVRLSNPTRTETRVTWGGYASCSRASSIDFRLVHNYASLPDVRVRNVNIPFNVSEYHGNTCNNGGTRQYYSEIAFKGLSSTVQRVSRAVTISHC